VKLYRRFLKYIDLPTKRDNLRKKRGCPLRQPPLFLEE